MATIPTLMKEGKLISIDAQLENGTLPERYMYALPHVTEWIKETIYTLNSEYPIEMTPLEQLDDILELFCSGKAIHNPRRFHVLHPNDECIWELKTQDLRIFGWFYKKDIFIISDINSTERVKKHSLYRGYVGQAKRSQNQLDIDPPKYIEGTETSDVISIKN